MPGNAVGPEHRWVYQPCVPVTLGKSPNALTLSFFTHKMGIITCDLQTCGESA